MIADDHTDADDDTDAAQVDLLIESLSRGNPIRFIAQGTSMERAVVAGSEVVVVPFDDDTPAQLFDVVLSLRPNFCVHRVIGKRSDGWLLLMGDNTNRPDGWVSPIHVVGRASTSRSPLEDDHRAISLPRPIPPRPRRAWHRLVSMLSGGRPRKMSTAQ